MSHHFPLSRYFVQLLLALIISAPYWFAANQIPVTAQSIVRVSDIQGNDNQSPLAERWVDTFGLVTALTVDGFYLQDPIDDNDSQSSDGVYVYLNRRPTVRLGDCVALTRALVDEYYGKTELSRLKAVKPSDRCRAQTITAVPIPLARLYSHPSQLFESFEGMLVQIDNLSGVVQGSTKRFESGEAEMALVVQSAALELAAGRIFQAQPEQSAALIFLSNALGGDLPDARWGDQIAVGTPTADGHKALAILDYNFGKYQLLLLPDQLVSVTAQPPPQLEHALPTKADEITICSSNLWALGRGTAQHPNQADFDREVKKRAKAIAETLFGCTIIGLQEVGALSALEALRDELRNQYGFDYAAWAGSGYQADNAEFPLTTGFLTLQERVTVNSIEMLQGCTSVNYEVLPGELTCPAGEFLLFDRPSLIVDLNVRGEWGTAPYRLRVITNHLKSKGGDESVNVVRRTAQAKLIAAKVQTWLDEDPNAQVIVLGDLNDYYDSTAVETLRTGVVPAFVHSYDLLPYLDRYSYVFNGASQVLDHVLVSPALQPQLAEVNVLHINSNFAYPERVDLTTVIHASDHDPVLLRLRPAGAATLSAILYYPALEAKLLDSTGALVDQQQSDDRGDLRFWNLRPGKYTVQLIAPSHITLQQVEFLLDLVAGENQVPPILVEHKGLELLRSAIETMPDLLNH